MLLRERDFNDGDIKHVSRQHEIHKKILVVELHRKRSLL